VAQSLGRLPALHRQVLVLTYLDGLAVQDIATELGHPGAGAVVAAARP
jgi:DNA-directed RNA polymerase specialized sigma24 family protein